MSEAQIGVDFLLGISIFLLTLGFMIQFIPDLFITTSTVGLSSVAYRTSSILTEDPGWWRNSTSNGTDWEVHSMQNTTIIGLAEDSTVNTRLTTTPNIINRTKLLRMVQLNKDNLTTKLGLYDNVNGVQVSYGYNITLTSNDAILIINNTPITTGETPPAFKDIFKMSRVVLVETGKVAGFNADELTTWNAPNDKVRINITPQSEDVIIQITNFNVTGNAKFLNAKLDSNLNIPSDYHAYKKTNTSIFFTEMSTTPIPLNSSDTLRLIFNHTLFPSNKTLELKFNQINFTKEGPPYIEYSSYAEPLYQPALLVVEVWR